MAIAPNTLNKFSTYNYIWSLDVLFPAELNTNSYRQTGGTKSIIRTGGSFNKQVTTAAEDQLGINVEYFIDDVNIHYLMTPNLSTGVSNATVLDFQVTEPYSMSLFLQTLAVAAQECGYRNYIEAPFLLTCEFNGYDDNGSQGMIEKKQLVIKLTSVTFDVSGSGTVYNVEAIAYNQYALTDVVQKVLNDVSLKGETVQGLLAGEQGLTKMLNDIEQRKVNETQSSIVPSVYEITFPNSFGSFEDQTSTDLFDNLLQTTTAVTSSRVGTPTNTDSNSIGNSKIVNDFTDFGTSPFAFTEQIYDTDKNVYTRGSLSIDPSSRVFQFLQNTKIEKVIEEVIKTSDFARNILDREPDERGMIDWYRIVTKVYIEGLEEQRATNKSAKRFVYEIHPYKIHKSKLSSPNASQNHVRNIKDVVKAYNYTYTGENLDVLNFEIKLNTAFFTAISNSYQPDQQETTVGSDVVAVDAPLYSAVTGGRGNTFESLNERSDYLTGTNASAVSYTSNSANGTGSNIDDRKQRIAKMVNEAILNSAADLITLDLTIWGDPYYIADSDFGNYVAQSSQFNINSDNSIDYLNGEVDAIVKFNNPVDYVDNLLSPNTTAATDAFNGIYRITEVEASFSNGQFTQVLKMLRRPNQDAQTVAAANAAAGSTGTAAEATVNSQIASLARDAANPFIPFASTLIDSLGKSSILTEQGALDLEKIVNIDTAEFVQQFDQLTEMFNQTKELQKNLQNSLSQIESFKDSFVSQISRLSTQINNTISNNTASNNTSNNTTSITNNTSSALDPRRIGPR